MLFLENVRDHLRVLDFFILKQANEQSFDKESFQTKMTEQKFWIVYIYTFFNPKYEMYH